jgi:hypothetical protein
VSVACSLDSERFLTCTRKSQIAIEFCHNHKRFHPNAHILWVQAGTQAKFERSFLDIAERLKIDHASKPVAEVLKAVTSWLRGDENKDWLLVIDSADSESLFFGHNSGQVRQIDSLTATDHASMNDCIPQRCQGIVLITTRNKRVARFAGTDGMVQVEPLSTATSLDMLRHKCSKTLAGSDGDLKELVRLLDYLPLAISQAAAYLVEEDVSIDRYLDLLRDSDKSKALFQQDYCDPRRDSGTPNSIFASCKVTYDEIYRRDRNAIRVLSLMAFLDKQSIQASLLRSGQADELSFNSAVGTLKAFDLISEERLTHTYHVHRLVQICTQRWLEIQGRAHLWQARATACVFSMCPSSVRFEHWQAWEELRPHAEAVLTLDLVDNTAISAKASLLRAIADYERKRGRIMSATDKASAAVALFKTLLGDRDLETAHAMEILAETYRSARSGQDSEAEAILYQALDIRLCAQGEGHADTITTMTRLIRVLIRLKKPHEAHQLGLRAVRGSKSVNGLKSAQTLSVLQDLAIVMMSLNEHKRAEDLWRIILRETQTSSSRERTSSTVVIMQNLAISIRSLEGRSKEAETLMRETLLLSESLCGKSHPDYLYVKTNLAGIVASQGALREAKVMWEEILEAQRKVIGPTHNSVKVSQRGLDDVVQRLRKLGSERSEPTDGSLEASIDQA